MQGLDPVISSLAWPRSISPLDLPDFETQARRLRYQALGDACREFNTQYLLLAHHNDDQAETVLMRLASGHKGLGLQGMRSKADIPESWGTHGVHQSGQRDLAASELRREEFKDPLSPKAQILRRILARPDVFEKGGVRILRPLLNFSKERLIETCRAQAVQWEEDKTNEDIWRTPRNNIRALLRGTKLPQALQKSSVLQLAERLTEYYFKADSTVMKLLAYCEILLLDVRCGALIIRFPRRFLNMERKDAPTVYIGKARLTALLLLRKVVQTVTPNEELSLQSLEQAAVSIFPDLIDTGTAADGTPQPTTFTGGGVQFQRLDFPLAAPLSELDPANLGHWKDLDPFFVWRLTRQPFSKAPPSLTVQPSAKTDSPVAENSPSWSPWRLWDSRYWIRLLNRACQPLIVRSFQPSDLHYLHSTLSSQRYKEFHHYLHLTVPGKVRWTLLALAEIGGDSLPMGRLLALPTLGKAGSFENGDASGTSEVEWQVRYKCIGHGYYISKDGYSRIGRNKNVITSWLD